MRSILEQYVPMKPTRSRLGVVLLLAVLLGGLLWRIYWPGALESDLPTTSAELSRDSEMAVDVGRTDTTGHAPSVPVDLADHESSAAEIYADTRLSPAQRFDLLAERGNALGDPMAMHLALGMAQECKLLQEFSFDKLDQGRSYAADYREQIRRQLLARCEGILSHASFGQFMKILDMTDRYVFVHPAMQAVREQYAEHGSQAALQAGFDALRNAPDVWMLYALGDVFEELDVFADYPWAQMQSVRAISPESRVGLTNSALDLLACYLGRPCGPDSFEVMNRCLMAGWCVPGADLRTIYQREIFNGQEFRDVEALLEYLRSLAPRKRP